MKTLSIAALLVLLGASPVGAAGISIQETDPATRCGLTAAGLIDHLSGNGVIFPQEMRVCSQSESAVGDAVNMDVVLEHLMIVDSNSDRALELVTLSRLDR